MELKQPPNLTILITLLLTILLNTYSTFSLTSPNPISPTPSPTTSSSSTLDPKQLQALESLNFPTSKDPCSNTKNATLCDTSKPFRHLLSLHLTNCSEDVSLSITALKSLSTLQDLQFTNCPIAPVRFPADLATNLRTFTCINSLRKLTGVFLSRFTNVTDLTVSGVTVNASGPNIILGNLKKLRKVIISGTNLTGHLPKSWHPNITYIDLSNNQLKGHIPTSISSSENLMFLNLSNNQLIGELPTSIGELIQLRNLSLSGNKLSGSVPESLTSMASLQQLDLSSNQFNGTIPAFLNDMKGLQELNLENNNFHGVMPFNGSFIKKMKVFKIGGNDNLCYNHSTISPNVKLGISPCDKNGFPMSPPAKSVSTGDDDSGDDEGSSGDETSPKSGGGGGGHGPNKVVLGVAIALSSIVFLIIFLILLSRRCA